MSATVVGFKGAPIPDTKNEEMAASLRRLADKAEAGEFVAMTFCALMANGSSYTAWNMERSYSYAMIGAAHCMMNDVIANTHKED